MIAEPLWSTWNVVHMLLANAVVMVGAAVQSTVGFGFALISVPLLALLDTAYAPGPTLMASLLLAAIMTRHGRHAIDFNQLLPGSLGLFAGAAIGAVILPMIAVHHLRFLFGGIIYLAVGLSLLGLKLPIHSLSLVGVGTLAGVMGTMAGIHGPPLALLYQREDADKVKAMLAVFFLWGYSISLLALGWGHLFGMRELTLGCSLMPGVAAGYLMSQRLSGIIQNIPLRGPILFVAGLSATALLLKG